MTDSDVVNYEVEGRKVVITINRPDAMNALSSTVMRSLSEAFDEFNSDDQLLVAILTGAGGRAFSAGADLKEMANRLQSDGSDATKGPLAPRPSVREAFRAIEESRKPVIAAIDGYCLAGGFELSLYCDIRIATEPSVFGLPEPRRSLIAGPGLIHLSRMIPLGEALRMQLTGSPISAGRAYEIGLISEVVEDREALFARANATADEIVECAPLAVQAIKRIVKTGRDLTVDAQWRYSEMYQAAIESTEDMLEGPNAFAEKRAPQWKMR
ncbi:enoyl-CoA hydratase-related protein [Microbacterium sp.]|uniref:enoyl-CoA hydratase-related protein n=1 Tax=Microbacterium sp. TaxID=51671 RepID=UPI002BEC225B|nr:enoyl-CoA hydratase-related protein [Microbacterium sp.]HWK76311.1 enoyl-CoA hydratase-related protein [Microbacterium sp.]